VLSLTEAPTHPHNLREKHSWAAASCSPRPRRDEPHPDRHPAPGASQHTNDASAMGFSREEIAALRESGRRRWEYHKTWLCCATRLTDTLLDALRSSTTKGSSTPGSTVQDFRLLGWAGPTPST
jgi:hypothetical protein